MPIYDYTCSRCGTSFEDISTATSSASARCPKCGERAEREFPAPRAIRVSGSPTSFESKITQKLETAAEERSIAAASSRAGSDPYAHAEPGSSE